MRIAFQKRITLSLNTFALISLIYCSVCIYEMLSFTNAQQWKHYNGCVFVCSRLSSSKPLLYYCQHIIKFIFVSIFKRNQTNLFGLFITRYSPQMLKRRCISHRNGSAVVEKSLLRCRCWCCYRRCCCGFCVQSCRFGSWTGTHYSWRTNERRTDATRMDRAAETEHIFMVWLLQDYNFSPPRKDWWILGMLIHAMPRSVYTSIWV